MVRELAITLRMCSFSISSSVTLPPTSKLRPDLNDFGQIVCTNLSSASENNGSLDEIAQFTKIARPVVRSHRFKRLCGEAAELFSCSMSKKIEMPFRNPFQVLETLSQRR